MSELFYNRTTEEIVREFDVDGKVGLSNREVKERQGKYGKNVIKVKNKSLLRKILEPFIDAFMLILIIALFISIFYKDLPEVIMVGLVIGTNAIIFYVQQFSSDRIIRNLKKQIEQPVRVLREGREIDVPAEDLVPGDVVILSEGAKVPADGRVLDESGLIANESMLTGESEPVEKDARRLSGERKIYERDNMVFSGSFIVTGKGRMVVVATGNNTEFGRIASLATGSKQVMSPVQDKINKLVKWIVIVALFSAGLVFVVSLLQGMTFVSSLTFTLAMMVSAVPEGLPVTIAIVLALGAMRMAKRKALIKEMRAIEAIGVITTIATDKTGTLTLNKLSVQEFYAVEKEDELRNDMVLSMIPPQGSADPLDTAIGNYVEGTRGARSLKGVAAIDPVKSFAFDQALKMSGNLYSRRGKFAVVIKGAPEVLLARSSVSTEVRASVSEKITEMAEKGYRVIAIGKGLLSKEINELKELPKSFKLEFCGLIAVADTLRREAPAAVRAAGVSGVSVRMITGDHARTAYEIGRQLGMAKDMSQVLDCSTLKEIPEKDLPELVRTITVFARVTPDDKYRILKALKKTDVVAMTGDGVNDVPAIAAADVGIAMGTATSIVQDAGKIVLLDDNFKSIIVAMREGRQIVANIRRMLVYLLSTNAGEVIVILVALFAGAGYIITPLQILWINIITDSIIVVPLGLEPGEKYFERMKPEKKGAPILSFHLGVRLVLMASVVATTTLAAYFFTRDVYGEEAAKGMAFVTLIVTQWGNAINTRGLHERLFERIRVRSRKFWIALVGGIALQVFMLSMPFGRAFLGITEIHLVPMLTIGLAAFLMPILVVEIHKGYIKKYNKNLVENS